LKKGQVIFWRTEHGGTDFVRVQDVVEQTISDRLRQTRHRGTLYTGFTNCQEKK
jgi:hypothetical protein